jgi:hypothetical protein
MKKLDRALIRLSEYGGDTESGKPKRWNLDSPAFSDRHFRISLYGEGLVTEWPKVEYSERIESAVEHPEVIEDMPWTWPAQPQVVSHRMRLFFETHAPGDGQFLPITIRQQKGRFFDVGEYWCVQWLRVIDCIDWERSRWKKVDNGEGLEWFEFGFMGAVFDPSKVPDDVQVFRPYGIPAHCVLMKSDLAKKLKKAKFTGPQFEYVNLSSDPPEILAKFAEPYSALKHHEELS